MKLITTLIFLFALQEVTAAPYYRFWRGKKLSHLPEQTYMNILTRDFMPQAPQLFPHLTSYLVAVPERHTGVDEVALLAYTNEEDYLRARNTPEGRGYGDAHWELFERESSGSLVPGPLNGFVRPNQAYDLLGSNLKWGEGVTYFYVGQRRNNLPQQRFLGELDKHLRDVRREFGGRGLRGFVVLVTEDREYAWMNFESEERAAQLFNTPGGRRITAHSASIMNTLQWSRNELFIGRTKRNGSYTVK